MKNNMSIVIGAIAFILILGAGIGVGYYVGNSKKNSIVEPTPTLTPTPSETPVVLDYSIRKNNGFSYELLVNGKSTTLTGLMEDSFQDINKLENMLVVRKYDIDFSSIYVIDSNANIVANFIGKSVVTGENSTITTTGFYTESYTINGNSIYIESNNIATDPTYLSCNAKSDDPVQYTEKFNYLGDNKFSASTISKVVTAKEYISTNNIKCN